MCYAVAECCSPNSGRLIYEFEMTPLLHSSQMSLNTTYITKSPPCKRRFDLSAHRGAEGDLQEERSWLRPWLRLLSSAAEGLMTLITPWAVLLCTSEAACGQGERSGGRESRSRRSLPARELPFAYARHRQDYPAHPDHVSRLIKLNISHRVHEMFTCFSPARASPPPSFPLLYGNCS